MLHLCTYHFVNTLQLLQQRFPAEDPVIHYHIHFTVLCIYNIVEMKPTKWPLTLDE